MCLKIALCVTRYSITAAVPHTSSAACCPPGQPQPSALLQKYVQLSTTHLSGVVWVVAPVQACLCQACIDARGLLFGRQPLGGQAADEGLASSHTRQRLPAMRIPVSKVR